FEGELPGYDKEFAYLEWEGEFGHRGRPQPAPSRDHIPPSASRSVYPKMPFLPQRMDRLFARPTYVHNAHIVGVQPELLSFGSERAEEVEIPVSVTVPLSWSKTDLNGYSSMPPTAGFYAIVHGKSAYVGRELHVRDRFYQRYRVITTELDINPDCFRNVQVYFARHTVSRPRTNQEVNNFYAGEIALIQ